MPANADQTSNPNRFKQRRLPAQKRSVERTQQIFETTARLLERVGIDDLTTILIAKELGLSVGALYHYFPNKHAILHGLGTRWLDEMTGALEALDQYPIESLEIDQFVDLAVERLLKEYQDQRALLPLMQIMSSSPELRELDQAHDELVIRKLVILFARLGLDEAQSALERKSLGYLEMTHAMFLLVVDESIPSQPHMIGDIKSMAKALLRSA